jgi:hypothetical protein
MEALSNLPIALAAMPFVLFAYKCFVRILEWVAARVLRGKIRALLLRRF